MGVIKVLEYLKLMLSNLVWINFWWHAFFAKLSTFVHWYTFGQLILDSNCFFFDSILFGIQIFYTSHSVLVQVTSTDARLPLHGCWYDTHVLHLLWMTSWVMPSLLG